MTATAPRTHEQAAAPGERAAASEPPGPVLVTRHNDVLLIELNRPEAKNAVTSALAHALRAALDLLDDDPDLSVGVISGAGGTFCAGMDLKAFATGDLPILDRGGFAGITALPPCKPLIAAVEGWALAGGLEIALACDLIVASQSARFGIPEASRGLVAAAGGLVELPRWVGPGAALHMALTGRPIDATEAHRLGLTYQVVEAGQAREAAIAIAEAIAANSPRAVQLSKHVIHVSKNWPARGWEAMQSELLGDIFTSADALEGAVAFRERRDPVWERR